MAKQQTSNGQVTFEVTLNKDKILAMIGAVKSRSAALIADIQIAGVSSVLHAALHGDTTYVTKLDEALGAGWYMATFRKWAMNTGVVAYQLANKAEGKTAGYVYSKDGAAKVKASYESDADKTTADLLGAKWQEAKREPPFEGFDDVAALARIVKKAREVAADPDKSKHPKTKVDLEFISSIEGLIEGQKLARSANPTVEADATVH